MSDTTASDRAPTSVADRLVRRDLFLLRLEAQRSRRGVTAGTGTVGRQRRTRSTR
jgi:hypothetical protein